jgi:predicted Rossmann-fold nucleotide-binding protein
MRGLRRVRVIVCGGRDYQDIEAVRTALRFLPPGTVIVHGGARGADSLADRVAEELDFSIEVFRARWDTEGRAAGVFRNQRMLDSGCDCVIAFPGGRGTADMVCRAEAAGKSVVRP